MSYLNSFFALPDNPAYIPNLSLDYTDEMSFFARMENFLMNIYHNVLYHLQGQKLGNELSKKYTGEDILTEKNLEYELSLLLVNSHFSFNYPRPMVPNVIEVGGIGIGRLGQLPKVRKVYGGTLCYELF